MQKSYIYDRKTGVYLGNGTYSTNHLDEPIIGAYETIEPPPEVAQNRVAKYLDENGEVPTHHGVKNASWVVHYDYKGTTYYTSSGDKAEIKEYNVDIPAGTLTEAPPNNYYKKHNGLAWIYDPADHIIDRCREVDGILSGKFNEHFVYNDNTWQIDSESQNKITARASRALLTSINPEKFVWSNGLNSWRTIDNQDITFSTPEEFLDFADSVSSYCENLWRIAANHKDKVRELTTESEIIEYDVNEGWE
ncbi:MAG: DUF4376 domain-containing protein [Desulfobacterales bacterium]|nr:DUF4376 domain-containing protein [Desulfobacterales bacterium]